MQTIIGTSKIDDDGDWLSVSDLMAGLMVIFLFIAIVFIRPLAEQNVALEEKTKVYEEQAITLEEQASMLEEQASQLEEQNDSLESQAEILEEQKILLTQQQDRISEIAISWQEAELNIYEALVAEFKEDLPKWNAEIEQDTLLIRFKAPDVLFAEGRSNLREEFQGILRDFFPRYALVLADFSSSIEEIRIEGHTSSEWNGVSPTQAYFNNMELSQARTREVLRFVLTLPSLNGQKEWLKALLTANGLSSSHLILDENGEEDSELSRRVEFRVRTTARSEIVRILEEVQ